MEGFAFLILLTWIWIVGTIINSIIAYEKGRSVKLIILMSILLSPIFGYAYILAVPSLPKEKK